MNNSSDRSFVSKNKIAVLYLARCAEGLTAFEQFISSYRQFPAGIEHDLVILYKGFENEKDLINAKSIFSPFPHIALVLPDIGFDIGSYYAAASQISHDYIICFNTFSRILDSNWLLKFFNAIILPDAGIVGATASYESTHSWMRLIQKAIWLSYRTCLPRRAKEGIQKYFFEFLPIKNVTSHPSRRARIKASISFALYTSFYSMESIFFSKALDNKFEKWWSKVKTTATFPEFCQYPLFPNPHIRSNAFMIKKSLLLSLKHPNFLTKFDTCHFESGYESMTVQILNAGLKAYVIGRDGNIYDLPQWYHSKTFRSSNQLNLLVSDNQTRAFSEANEAMKALSASSAWGQNNVPIPSDFPSLNIAPFSQNLSFNDNA